jgi:hypothetical protein
MLYFAQLFREQEGFETLVLSDPRLDKKMYRLGWIVFKEGTDLDKALAALGEIKVRITTC